MGRGGGAYEKVRVPVGKLELSPYSSERDQIWEWLRLYQRGNKLQHSLRRVFVWQFLFVSLLRFSYKYQIFLYANALPLWVDTA